MSKVILEFDIPEEKEAAEIAQKAGAYYSMLWDIQQYIRTLTKYEEREAIPVEEIADKLRELLSDYDA